MPYLSYVWDDEAQKYVNIGGTDYSKIYYDTKAGWDAKNDLIAQKNTMYVYTDASTITDGEGTVRNLPGVKIGDGTSYLIDMQLITTNETTMNMFTAHTQDTVRHITQEERDAWNAKCRVDESQATYGLLILTND